MRHSWFIICLLAVQFAWGWSTYPDLPPWMHRGNLRWISGGASTREAAQSLADQGVNLLWGGFGTSDPALIDYMVANGIHRTTYLCSTSIFWNSEDPKNIFKLYPPLLQGTAMEADGTRTVLYANPLDRDGATRRFGGCRIAPEWLEYQQHRMTFYALGGQPFPDDLVYKVMKSDPQPRLDVFFLDNPFLLTCYCPRCQDAWAVYCTKRFGVVVPDPERCPDERVRNAWDTFWLEANANYIKALKAYAHGMTPARFIAPNWIHGYPEYYEMMEQSQPDIVLIELGGGGERPWGRSEFSYKATLAATDGKAMANIWCFPAARPRIDYERPALPFLKGQMPESSYLTAAEAVACQGTYLSSGPPEFGKFLKRYNRIYGDAQPAAKVALVYSTATELWRRRVFHVKATDFLGPHWWIGMDYTPTVHMKHFADKLSRLGIPYDVLVERQLNDKELAAYDCVILPDVQCIGPAAAKALNAYAGRGGSVVVGEQFAVRDHEGNLLSRREAKTLGGTLSTADRIIAIRPDTMTLDGFLPDGLSGRIAIVPSRGEKTATASIKLTKEMLPVTDEPICIRAECFDEAQRMGSVVMRLNGRKLASLKLDQQSDEFRWVTAYVDRLHTGDVLSLEADGREGELCRIEQVQLADTSPGGEGEQPRWLFTYIALDQLRESVLQGIVDLMNDRGQRWQTARPNDDLYINVLHPADSKALALHVVNPTVEDPHAATILDSPACAARRTIALTSAQRGALAKPVVSLLGFTPDWTQTYFSREIARRPFAAKEATKAWLVVRVNGQVSGRLPLGTLADGWTDVPVDPKLLRDTNEVEVKVEGDVGCRRSYYGLLIDPAGADDSRWTPAPWSEGKPESPRDLSPYVDEQTGAYRILLRNVDDKAALPSFQAKHRAVEGATVRLPADEYPTPVGVYLTPEQPTPVPLEITRDTRINQVIVHLPRVDIYGVALVANSKGELQELLK